MPQPGRTRPADGTHGPSRTELYRGASALITSGLRLLELLRAPQEDPPAFHQQAQAFSTALVQVAHEVAASLPMPAAKSLVHAIEVAGEERAAQVVTHGIEAGEHVRHGRWAEAARHVLAAGELVIQVLGEQRTHGAGAARAAGVPTQPAAAARDGSGLRDDLGPEHHEQTTPTPYGTEVLEGTRADGAEGYRRTAERQRERGPTLGYGENATAPTTPETLPSIPKPAADLLDWHSELAPTRARMKADEPAPPEGAVSRARPSVEEDDTGAAGLPAVVGASALEAKASEPTSLETWADVPPDLTAAELAAASAPNDLVGAALTHLPVHPPGDPAAESIGPALTETAAESTGRTPTAVADGLAALAVESGLLTPTGVSETLGGADGDAAELTGAAASSASDLAGAGPESGEPPPAASAPSDDGSARTSSLPSTDLSTTELGGAPFVGSTEDFVPLAGVQAPSTVVPTRPPSSWEQLPFGPPAQVSPPGELPLRPYQRVAADRLDGHLDAERSAWRDRAPTAPVVNLPTGAGKTLVGAEYVRRQLAQATEGEAILIVVPSSIIAQQWRDALCYDAIGPGLPSSAVFNGTPSGLARYAKNHPGRPSKRVLILTQQGVDRICRDGELEGFLAGLRVRHVLLDEVHKMVADPQSVAFHVTQAFRQGQLAAVVGFSATTDGARARLSDAGLKEVVRIEPEAMVPTGYVPPFQVKGAVATLSTREVLIQKKVAELREACVLEYLELLDHDRLKARFRELVETDPAGMSSLFTERLGKYRGRGAAVREQKVLTRLRRLIEDDKPLGRAQLDLLLAVQLHDGLSDAEMASPERYGRPGAAAALEAVQVRAAALRAELAEQIKLPQYRQLLEAPFGEAPTAGVQGPAQLGQTLAGTAEGLRLYSLHFGSGLAETVLTLHHEETRRRRGLSATFAPTCSLVFAKAQEVRPAAQPLSVSPGAVPGMVLEAGLHPTLRATAVGIQANQAVFLRTGNPDLELRIARFAQEQILEGELVPAILNQLLAELPEVPGFSAEALRAPLTDGLRDLVAHLVELGSNARVYQWDAFRKGLAAWLNQEGRSIVPAAVRKELLERVRGARNNDLLSPVAELFEWANAVRAVRHPKVVRAATPGVEGELGVIEFRSARMRELLRNLLCRAVDADGDPELPADLRVGIDVAVLTKRINTADAFRQLVGRLLRAAPSWKAADAQLLAKLIGTAGVLADQLGDLSEDERQRLQALCPASPPAEGALGDEEHAALQRAWELTFPHRPAPASLEAQTLDGLTADERIELACALLSAFNKGAVTAYEVFPHRASTKNPELQVRRGLIERSQANSSKLSELPLPTAEGTITRSSGNGAILNPSTRTSTEELAGTLRRDGLEMNLAAVRAWLKGNPAFSPPT